MNKRSSIDNTYLFSFDLADIIRDTAAKAYGLLMEKTDPDEEETEKIREFLKYLEDLDRQIWLAKDFLSRQQADNKLSALDELTSPNKAKERKERINSLLAKKTDSELSKTLLVWFMRKSLQ